MKCTKCSYTLADGMKFCHECGEKQENVYGSGVVLGENMKFCHSCGTPVGGTATPKPTPVATLKSNSLYEETPRDHFVIEGDVLIKMKTSKDKKQVVVPEGITKICSDAFERSDKIETLILPDSLIEFGTVNDDVYPLYNMEVPQWNTIPNGGARGSISCDGLKKVRFGKNLKIIGHDIFEGCKGLREIDLPDSLLSLGASAFENTGLKEVTLPPNLVTVFSCAFAFCEALEEVRGAISSQIIPGSRMYGNVFKNCPSLQKAILPANMEAIHLKENNCFLFEGCLLVEWEAPNPNTKHTVAL